MGSNESLNMGSKRPARMTPQRKLVLEELKQSKSHPTADEIYERVRKHLPRISLGTVYRNLDVLARQGVIRKVDIHGTQMRFDANRDFHFHVRCLNCGAIDDVVVKDRLLVKEMVEHASGYAIEQVRLEFLGHCPKCSRGDE